MKNFPLVSIIIINWNGINLLRVSLPSLKKISYKNYEVILVDNGSIDNSLEYAKKIFPKIKLVRNKTNLGFAKANNQGISLAKGELILFLNNDTKVTRNFLSILVDKLVSDKSMGACQPKILHLEKKGRLDSIGSFLTNSGFLYHLGFEAKDTKVLSKEIKLFSGKGSCLLFRKKLLDKIGYFDEDFFAYFEETDLCWRLWLSGHYLLYIPESVIFHKTWGTARKLPIELVNFHSFKNRITSLIVNLEFINLAPILIFHLLICIFIIIFYLFRGKINISTAIIKSILWNISVINKTLEKRSKVQSKIRKLRDSDIFPTIMKKAGLSYYLFILKYSLIRSKVFRRQV
jgi:hypothetical protein